MSVPVKTDTDALITQALGILREGRIQDADNLLAATKAALEAETAAALSDPPPPPPPRAPLAILGDLMHLVSSALGNPAPILSLLAELEAALSQ